MIDKVHALWPEITLILAACVVMVVGLSRNLAFRRLCLPITLAALAGAGLLAYFTTPVGSGALVNLPEFGKVLAASVGILIALLIAGTPDREYEIQVARGAAFDPLRTSRAEFYAFFLFSITGLMLCAGASDLIWLFLALELTSLPTYIMVVISTTRNKSMEAGVKYFFLGALGAATFLYGFALLYGATGTSDLARISSVLADQVKSGGLSGLAMAGLLLSILGICFKIAAVPMHFYTADVYQGSSASVAGMLAFVPKTAGFFALLILCATLGWYHVGIDPGTRLPEPIYSVLWVIAVLTMTVGNVLAVVQTSVKRILAYSSIAHSGYMLVGVIVGPGIGGNAVSGSGISAVLFYLIAYGVMNLGAFAVLACLERQHKDGHLDEIDDVEDLRGLCNTRPLLGWTMVLSAMGLLGLPLTGGFWAKLPLFTSGIASGEYVLIVILGLNSAIAAYYYIRLAGAALLSSPDLAGRSASIQSTPFATRVLAGALSAMGVVALAVRPITDVASKAGTYARGVEERPIIKPLPPDSDIKSAQ